MPKNKHKSDDKKSGIIYDFTHFKITRMIDELEEEYSYHPDLDALKNILECYETGEIVILWEGGYPMPDIEYV
jgi:hypothetical protein